MQVWRYFTDALDLPAIGSAYILSVLLGIAIFVLIGWGAERQFGCAGTRSCSSCRHRGRRTSGIALGASIGLIGAVWGIFGAYLIVVWPQPAARNRLLITMAIWFVFSLFFGNIVALIGGAAGGIGAILLLRRYDDRPQARPSTPYLILAAGLAVLIALAILARPSPRWHDGRRTPRPRPLRAATGTRPRDLHQLPAVRPADLPAVPDPGRRRRAVPGVRARGPAGCRGARPRWLRALRPSGTPVVTYVLIGLYVVIYALQWMTGGR